MVCASFSQIIRVRDTCLSILITKFNFSPLGISQFAEPLECADPVNQVQMYINHYFSKTHKVRIYELIVRDE